MKVEILRDENNRAIGWTITGETPEEKLTVNTIRNLQFWGSGDTSIEYAGREGGSKDNSDAGTLKWKQSIHNKPVI